MAQTKRKPLTVKQTAAKYDKTIKDAEKLYKKTLKGIPKKDRVPFQETKDFKVLNKRKSNAVWRVKNRAYDLERKQKQRVEIKKKQQVAGPKFVILSDGPFFEVMSYTSKGNSLLYDHATKLKTKKQKYLGIIKFQKTTYKYQTIDGFFDRVRELYKYARKVDSGLMAQISEYSDPTLFAQMVEIFADESEFEQV
jgi:hypothetical protein